MMIRVLVVLAMVAALVGVMAAPAAAQQPQDTIAIDKTAFNALGTITLTVADDTANVNPGVTEVIVMGVDGVWAAANAATPANFNASETGPDTGIFTSVVTLIATTDTPGIKKLQVDVVDQITATYVSYWAVGGVPTAVGATDTANYDSIKPVTTITSAVYAGGVITVGVTSDDDPLAIYAGAEAGIIKIEVSVDDGAWEIAHYDPGVPVSSKAVTFYVDAPDEGAYVIKARGQDAALNVESAITAVIGNVVTVYVDTTDPVVSAAAVTREDAGTAADTIVDTGQNVDLAATIVETGAGIPVVADVTIDEDGLVTLLATWVAPADPTMGVFADGTEIGAGAILRLEPPEDLVQTAVDKLIANGVLVKPAAGATLLTLALAMDIIGSGEWTLDGITAAPVAVGAKDISYTAKDANGNLTASAVDVEVTVVTDTTDPVVDEAATMVTYAVGEQAKAGDVLVISTAVSDDVAGVATVTVDMTTLAPSDASIGYVAATGYTMPAVPAAPGVVTAVPMHKISTGVYGVKIVIGAAVTAGDKAMTFTVTDNAGNTETGTGSATVVVERTTLNVALAVDSNFVSIPKALTSAKIWEALAPIAGKVNKVYAYVGGVPMSATPIETSEGSGLYVWKGDLTEIVPGMGYIIDMDEAATLDLTFSLVDPVAPMAPVNLGAGWNLIGFASRTMVPNMPVTSYLSALSWTVLYNYPGWDQVRPIFGAAPYASAGFPVDGTGAPAVQLAKAYWVYLTADGVIAP